MGKQRGIGVVSAIASIVCALVILIGLGAAATWFYIRWATPQLGARRYAVVLTNGQVYVGKIEALGTRYPILTDVYYVQQSQPDPQTKQVANFLVKRGTEWHQPDRMFVNQNQILFFEPIGPNSRVAQLIAESEKK